MTCEQTFYEVGGHSGTVVIEGDTYPINVEHRCDDPDDHRGDVVDENNPNLVQHQCARPGCGFAWTTETV